MKICGDNYTHPFQVFTMDELTVYREEERKKEEEEKKNEIIKFKKHLENLGLLK